MKNKILTLCFGFFLAFTSNATVTKLDTAPEFDFDFLYINSEMDGDKAVISWTSTNESGGVYVVERTSDGTNFKKIGKTPCRNKGSYALADKKPLTGIFYYRLRYTDSRGKSWVSPIVPIKNVQPKKS